MTTPFPKILSLASLLWGYVFVGQLARGYYFAGQTEVPYALTLLYGIGFVWLMGNWLREDCRERGLGWVSDMGLFLYVIWWLILPYHLIRTRGVKGLLIAVIFFCVYLGSLGLGAVLGVVVTVLRG